LRVALVERGGLGGTCLHRGCVPSRALLASAELYRRIRSAEVYGVTVRDAFADFGRMVARKNAVVGGIASNLERSLRQSGVSVLTGDGVLLNAEPPFRTRIGGEVVTARAVVLATGSESAAPDVFGVDGERVVTSTEALNWESLPGSVLVVGGGVIGCEFVCLFRAFDVSVTVVEALPRILATEDIAVSRQMATLLKRDGVDLRTGTKVTALDKTSEGVRATLSSGDVVSAERALIAVGRRRNGVGFDALGIRVERGKVVVNERMETTVPGVYAVGDVASDVLLAHWASAQGEVAGRNVLGDGASFDGRAIPACIYTSPEIGRVGWTEDGAKGAGFAVVTARLPFGANARAQCLGEISGFVKVVADKASRRILGVHILGPDATEIVHAAVVALRAGMTVEDYCAVVHAHPTYSESLREAMTLFAR
jgi:dihydrolipoamide dehydrogenase